MSPKTHRLFMNMIKPEKLQEKSWHSLLLLQPGSFYKKKKNPSILHLFSSLRAWNTQSALRVKLHLKLCTWAPRDRVAFLLLRHRNRLPFVSKFHCTRVAIFKMTCNENSTDAGVIMCADTTLMWSCSPKRNSMALLVIRKKKKKNNTWAPV